MKPFIIHLDRDEGRARWVEGFKRKLDAEYTPGVDLVRIEDRVIVDWPAQPRCTEAAKRAKMELFEKFLTTDHDHLLMLEDDLIPHRDFDRLFRELEAMIPLLDFDMLYLGLSSRVDRVDEPGLTIVGLDPKRVYSGAYGVILPRETLKMLLERYRTHPQLKYKPFDDFYLGFLQQHRPGRAFVTQPQLLAPSIVGSNIRAGREQSSFFDRCALSPKDFPPPFDPIPAFVIVRRHEAHLHRRFRHAFAHLMPVVEPVWVVESGVDFSEPIALRFTDSPEEVLERELVKQPRSLVWPITVAYLVGSQLLDRLDFYQRSFQRVVFSVGSCPRCRNRHRKTVVELRVPGAKKAKKVETQLHFYDLTRCLEIESPEHRLDYEDFVADFELDSRRTPKMSELFERYHLTRSRQLLETVGTKISRREVKAVKLKLLKHLFTTQVDRKSLRVSRSASALKREVRRLEPVLREWGDPRFTAEIPIG